MATLRRGFHFAPLCVLALCLLASPLASASSVSLTRHELTALPKGASSVQRAAIFARHYRKLLLESPALSLADLGASEASGSAFELRPRAGAASLSSLTVLNESLAELRALSEEALGAGERAALDTLLKRILVKLAREADGEATRESRHRQRLDPKPLRIEPVATEPMYPHLIRLGVSKPYTLFTRTTFGGRSVYILRDNASGVDLELSMPDDLTGTPVLSPDGEKVYFGLGGVSKSIASYSTRHRTTEGMFLRRHTDRVGAIKISPDGRYLFYFSQHGLAVEPLTTDPLPPGLEEIPYVGGHTGYVVSPDSRWVATGNSRGRGFELADLDTGEHRLLEAPASHEPLAQHFRRGSGGREMLDILVTEPETQFGKSWLATFDLATSREIAREELPDLLTGARADIRGVFVDGGRGLALYQLGLPMPARGLLRFYERGSGRLVTANIEDGENILTSDGGSKITLIHGKDVSHYDLEAGYRAAFDPNRWR